MKKQIVLLGFFLLIFSLHADSYYKEEGRLEDGTRYIKEAWTRETKERKTEKKRIVPIEKRGSSANVDVGVLYNLAKKRSKISRKIREKI
ncbi:hypothetical protein HMPREF9466_01931 [Fusobacterium necrophorum subsp. funduliforme 1_1_36S]|nr:hypothetical protein HMPREF9466_01931 [Fusobacterium necrophorum subsp. funduliforme 1_1_36S]